MQGGMHSGTRLGGQGWELDYNGDLLVRSNRDLPVRRYRDRDMGRGVVPQGRNSGTESEGNSAK